jgi:hypothetical protein
MSNKKYNDLLNAELGNGERELKIVDLNIKSVKFNDGHEADKLFITCKTLDGEREFIISEAWNETKTGKRTQGLWIQLDNNGKLVANSNLGNLLNYYKVSKISDLKGKHVFGYPDENGYLVLTTINMTTDEKEKEESLFE